MIDSNKLQSYFVWILTDIYSSDMHHWKHKEAVITDN